MGEGRLVGNLRARTWLGGVTVILWATASVGCGDMSSTPVPDGARSEASLPTEMSVEDLRSALAEAVAWTRVEWERASAMMGTTLIRTVTVQDRDAGLAVSSVFMNVDAAMGLGGGPPSGDIETLPDGANFRFVMAEDGVLMENPAVEEDCGTRWIRLASSPADLAEEAVPGISGLGVDLFEALGMAEPLKLLSESIESASSNDSGGLDIQLPAAYVVAKSAIFDGALDDLPDDYRVSGRVSIADEAITVTASAGELYRRIAEGRGDEVPAGFTSDTTWIVRHADEGLVRPEPERIAELPCA